MRKMQYVLPKKPLRSKRRLFVSILLPKRDALENKEVKAPFIPLTKDGEVDTTNVASYFKRLDAADSPVDDSLLGASVEAARHFPGFTYNPESVITKTS